MYKLAMAPDVSPKEQLKRMIAIVVAAVIASYLILLLSVQTGERLTRRRAELLLTDIRGLQLQRSTWNDAQKFMSRWGRWAHYEGQCTPHNCEYAVSFRDWLSSGPFPRNDYLFPFAERAFIVLHAHMPWVQAIVSVHDGVIDKIYYFVGVYVPKGYGPGWDGDGVEPSGYVEYKSGDYWLMAVAKSTASPRRSTEWPELEPHPEYSMAPPDGCEGCMGFNTEFTAQTKKEDLNWLLGFNFSCMTRWSPCTTQGDLMDARCWSRYVVGRKARTTLSAPAPSH